MLLSARAGEPGVVDLNLKLNLNNCKEIIQDRLETVTISLGRITVSCQIYDNSVEACAPA